MTFFELKIIEDCLCEKVNKLKDNKRELIEAAHKQWGEKYSGYCGFVVGDNPTEEQIEHQTKYQNVSHELDWVEETLKDFRSIEWSERGRA